MHLEEKNVYLIITLFKTSESKSGLKKLSVCFSMGGYILVRTKLISGEVRAGAHIEGSLPYMFQNT